MLKFPKDEEVELIIRKHWFLLFQEVLGPIILLFVPVIILAAGGLTYLDTFFYAGLQIHFTLKIFVFASSLWFLYVWIKLFSVWINYRLDMWVITTKSMINVEQKGFFRRELSTLRIERIQDISIETEGVLATLLDYGDLEVESAAEMRKFIVKGLPHPKEVKELILEKMDRVIPESGREERVGF